MVARRRSVAELVRSYVAKFRRDALEGNIDPDDVREYVTFHLFDGYDLESVGGARAVWAWLAEDRGPDYMDEAIERYHKRGRWQTDISPSEQLAAMVITEHVVHEGLRVTEPSAAWQARWGRRG